MGEAPPALDLILPDFDLPSSAFRGSCPSHLLPDFSSDTSVVEGAVGISLIYLHSLGQMVEMESRFPHGSKQGVGDRTGVETHARREFLPGSSQGRLQKTEIEEHVVAREDPPIEEGREALGVDLEGTRTFPAFLVVSVDFQSFWLCEVQPLRKETTPVDRESRQGGETSIGVLIHGRLFAG